MMICYFADKLNCNILLILAPSGDVIPHDISREGDVQIVEYIPREVGMYNVVPYYWNSYI